MTKKEFARRAMDIALVCIEKDIEANINLFNGYQSLIVLNDNIFLNIYNYDATEEKFDRMKKLVEECEG